MNSINKNSVIIGIVIILLGIGIFLGLDNESMQDNNSAVDEKERREPEEFHVNAVSKTVFEPAMLNLQVGDTVTWTNIDSEVHSVSSSNVTSDGGVYFQTKTGVAGKSLRRILP